MGCCIMKGVTEQCIARLHLTIIQGVAAIGGMMIKGINALVGAKRASSLNNAIKLVNENVQITHDRLITLENRTAMMAKVMIPILKDFKEQINNTNDRLIRQYRMMTRAHERYNRLFRQTHETFRIHHLALLMFNDYIMILVGTLRRIHRQYVYKYIQICIQYVNNFTYQSNCYSLFICTSDH